MASHHHSYGSLPDTPDSASLGPREEPVERLEPLGRRGQCCLVKGDKLYLYGGYSQHYWSSQPRGSHLDVFDFTNHEWSSLATTGEQPTAISGACCVGIKNCLYLFGGWYQGWRNADVHELDLILLKWRKLAGWELEGGPMCKDKAGMVDYGEEMLCVMGGYGYPGNELGTTQPGATYSWDTDSVHGLCWTNELHLFHIKSCKMIGGLQ